METMEFVYFLGRFHVLALHVPIGALLAVALLEVLSRTMPRFQSLRVASPFLWGVAAVSAIGTVALGFMHVSEGGFDGPSVSRHMFFGSSVAVVATAVWGLALIAKPLFERAAMWAGIVLVVLVSLTGHYGGNITHGSTYLVEYAPGFIRALHDGGAGRSRVTDFALADPFSDVVKPILDRRCMSCHNDDRRRGELSMATYESLMSGGEFLPVVVAGDSAASALIARITLYPGHEDFMPAEGKTPLTGRQTEILRWWVDAGAPANTTLGEIELTPAAEALLRAELGLPAAAGG
jgi:hypothetical protein